MAGVDRSDLSTKVKRMNYYIDRLQDLWVMSEPPEYVY